MEGGGAERQLTYLAASLVEARCDVHVALTRGGHNLARLAASGATIHTLPSRVNHDPRLLTRIHALIRAVRPALVQCWMPQMEFIGGLASIWAATPWIFTERSSGVDGDPRTVKRWLRSRIAAKASAIIANSRAGDDYWRARVSARTRRYVIANAVPFEEIGATAPATREEAGLRAGEALVLYAGRFDPGKNAPIFARAIRQLPASAPVRGLLCGEGPERGELERLSADAGPAARLRLSGYATNLWSLMKRAAVFVSPSLSEGNPNVVLEAIACECPLVVSDIAAHREILDGDSAIFVAANDPAAVAAAIMRVLEDPGGAAARARQARQQVRGQTPALVAERYLRAYREVLASRDTSDHQRWVS